MISFLILIFFYFWRKTKIIYLFILEFEWDFCILFQILWIRLNLSKRWKDVRLIFQLCNIQLQVTLLIDKSITLLCIEISLSILCLFYVFWFFFLFYEIIVLTIMKIMFRYISRFLAKWLLVYFTFNQFFFIWDYFFFIYIIALTCFIIHYLILFLAVED